MHRLRSALATHVGGLPARFWWLWGGAFVSALATFVFLFLAVYLTARGFDPPRVGRTVAAFGLGSLAAGPLGGTLADRIGRRPTLLGALVASATVAACVGFARAPALIAVGVFAFGLAATSVFPAIQFQVAAPIAMSRNGLTPSQIGRVLAVNGLLIGALQPFAARVFGERDPARVVALGTILVGAGYGAYALCHTTASYAGATAVWTLGEITTMPVAVALVARLAPSDLRGRYNGAYSLAFGAGQTFAPLVGGSALALAGAGALFTGCLVVCLAVAAAHLALGAARRRRREPCARALSP